MTTEVSVWGHPRRREVDGRHLRSERTRQIMIGAYLKFVRLNNRVPTAVQVARLSGYALRSVFERFTSLDELNLAAVDYAITQSRKEMVAAKVEADRPARMMRHVDARAGICEEWLPLWRVSLALSREAQPSTLVSRLEKAHREYSAWLADTYRHELEAMPAGRRGRMLAVLAALTSFENWYLLRHGSSLSLEESKQAWCDAMERLLT